jgi:hypothetical protein
MAWLRITLVSDLGFGVVADGVAGARETGARIGMKGPKGLTVIGLPALWAWLQARDC